MTDPVFVGRERQLEQLQKFLAGALAGNSQVCFVTGEAGAGKSTLIGEFLHRAQTVNADIVVATGTCSSQTGSGDPYLPFRQILAQLTDATQAKQTEGEGPGHNNQVRVKELLRVSANALVEVSPDLLGLLLPGGAIAGRAVRVMATKAGLLERIDKPGSKAGKSAPAASPELDQTKLMEQYAAALQTLAKQKPLAIVLEDLHWADNASLDLLFHLSRQLKDSRVLLLGTFRPDDIALGRDGGPHPLENILNEVKRYRGEAVVDLGRAVAGEGEAFVNGLVDAEPNRLSKEFRKALFQKTCGHPLFTVELLRAMQENGDLIHDEEGHWVQAATLHWEALPARVEGVIQHRISKLSEELCDLLRTASVQGPSFTAQVVAQVQHVDERQVIKNLSRELDRRYRLVHEEGESRVGRQVLSAYQFAHALFQQFLYGDLSSGERRLLHGDIAHVLESLYGTQVDTIAVQLAHHYDQAGELDKAIEYLGRAGIQALKLSAFHEAADAFERGLTLALDDQSPDSVRIPLLLNLGCTYYVWGKLPQAAPRLSECLDLARQSDEKAAADAQYYLGLIALRSGKRDEAKTLLEASLAAEDKLGDKAKVGGLYCALGGLAARQGDRALAKENALKGVAILKELGESAALASAFNSLGTFCQHLGEYEEAEQHLRTGLAVYQRLKDRVGASRMLNNLGYLHYERGQYTEAARFYEECLAIQREMNNPDMMAALLGNLGEVSLETGDLAKAKRYELEALEMALETGLVPFVLEMLFIFAQILAKEGDSCQVAELLGLVSAHPQSDYRCKENVQTFLNKWTPGLSQEELAAALERGRGHDLNRIVEELRQHK